MTDPKNLNKCCPTNDGNVGKAIHSLSNRIKYLERANSDIENSLDEEKSRAIDVENTLQQHIEEEQNRASTKEEEILLGLNEEQTRAENAELALSNKIDEDIETERNRAIDVETTILSNLTEEIDARKQAINNVINSIPEAQILPDWNLTDSNAKDFIKNKPHSLDGKSAYELAVDNGFEGTEQEWLASLKGSQGIDGSNGADGQDGAPGLDGHSPVVTASKSGSTTTIYVDGTSIATIEDGLNGQDGQNGTNGTNGLDGITPHIDPTTKHWMIGETDTNIVAEGQTGSNGTNGSNGVTPHIDSTTGNWFIGTTDTGVHALGPAGLDGSNGTNGNDGQDGHTPVITASKSNGVTTVSVDGTPIATINDGQNGSDGTNGTNGLDGVTPHIDSTSKHWMIGSTDTGIVAEGQNGITPHIDSTTKHWMIGETDTGVVAEGLNVADPVTQSELEEVEKVTAIALTHLDERVSDLENDSVSTSSNYYDKSEIDLMFVNAASGGSVDLSGYAKTADLATVATSGSYTDLSNTPTIPDAQIQSDWNLTDTSSKDYIKNKPQVSDGKTRSPGISFEPPAKTGTNYTYVDLGLPSGTLWATKNVGASDEYDDGLYFSWGNIEGYENPSTSIFSTSAYESSIAYTLNSSIQPTTSFDAAKYNMGDSWRMPTRAEVLELIDNTDITWVANQYVKFAKKTDNSVYIIIPNYLDDMYNYNATYSSSWRSAGFLCSDYKYESPGKHYGSRACFVNNNYPDDTDYHLALAVWYYLKTPGFPVRGVQNPNDTNQIEPANYKQISAAKVAVTGSYNDLTDKPTIPDISGKANTADLAAVATSGDYNDLSNKPIIDRVHITKDTQLSTSSLYIPNVALNSSGDYELNVSSLIKYDLITQLNNGQTQCSQADFAFGAPAAYSPDGYPCGASFTLYNASGFSSSFYSGATSRQVFWFNEGGRVLTSENCGNYSVAKVWRGTQAQYDAITNPDNNTIYIITAT